MTRTKLIIILVGVLATGGGSAYFLLHEAEATPAAGPEYSVENLKKAADDPAQMRERMQNLWQREDLTEEQRREAFDNMRQMMETRMDTAIDEYMTATDDQKDAVLDKHLDEMQKHMKEWEKGREAWEKERAKRQAEGQDKPPQEGANGERRGRGGWSNMSTAERKSRSEERSPDQMARRMAYFKAVAKRAGERGISMPGPFGRGGGPGRGPGGGGPGGGGGRPGGSGGNAGGPPPGGR